MNNELDRLLVDLHDIDVSEVEVLTHEGTLGMEAFAASTGTHCCAKGACSCSIDEDEPVTVNE